MDVASLFLGGDFDDARFVDDASRAVSFLDNSDDPRLVALLLLDVFAVGRGLFAWQADQESTGGLGGVSLQQLEHVPAGLGDCSHLGDDWKVVDDEGHLILLVRRECLSVSEQAEASDVGGAVSVVLVHQAGRGAVETSHGVHRAVISFADVFLRHNQLDSVPAFRLFQPLVSVDGDLSSQRFRQHQDVTHNGVVWNDVVVRVADGGSDSADGAPRIDDTLSTGD